MKLRMPPMMTRLLFEQQQLAKAGGDFDRREFDKDIKKFDKELALVYLTAKIHVTDDQKDRAKIFLLDKWHTNMIKSMRRYIPSNHYGFAIDLFVKNVWDGKHFKKLAERLKITEADMEQFGARVRATLGG